MTLKELEELETEVFTAKQIAPLLHSNPDTIRWQAFEAPELLGFPVIVTKTRVKIPKRPFLAFMRNGAGYKRIRGIVR